MDTHVEFRPISTTDSNVAAMVSTSKKTSQSVTMDFPPTKPLLARIDDRIPPKHLKFKRRLNKSREVFAYQVRETGATHEPSITRSIKPGQPTSLYHWLLGHVPLRRQSFVVMSKKASVLFRSPFTMLMIRLRTRYVCVLLCKNKFVSLCACHATGDGTIFMTSCTIGTV